MADVGAIFEQDKIEKHSDYYLQTFLYSMIVSTQHEKKVVPALFFVQQSSQEDYNPTLKLGKDTINDIKSYQAEFEERLKEVVNEIFNPDIPFRPTETTSRCTNCPFKELCGC